LGFARISSENSMSADANFVRSGGSAPPRQLSLSSHEVEFYEQDAVLLDGLSRKFGSVLGAGDAVVVIATERRRRGLAKLLHERGLDLLRATQQGRYVELDAADTLSRFMVEDAPDLERFKKVVGGVIDTAAAVETTHRRGVCAFGEMVALLCEQGKIEAAIQLEKLWNELASTHAFSLHCAYPLRLFASDTDTSPFQRICSEHSHVVPTESYTSVSEQGERLRMVSLLQQKAHALQGVAEERQRLATELTIEVEDLRQLHEVSTRLSGLVSEDVMRQVLSAVAGLHGTEMGLLSLCDQAADRLRLGASLGFSPQFLDCVKEVPLGKGACGSCMEQCRTVTVADTQTDSVFEDYRELARLHGFRAVHSTPLIDRNGTLLGVLSVHFPEPHVPTVRQIRLTDLYAQLASAAIENAQLYQEAQQEIVRRRDVEKALKQSEEFSRGIVESSVDCIKVLDSAGVLLYISPPGQRALAIQDVSQVLGRNWVDFWRDEDHQQAQKALSVAQSGAVGRMQGFCASLSGTPKWWDVTVVPMRTTDGHIDRLLVTSRDITELRHAQCALLQVEKLAATGRMAATIAHEINNPLEAVTNFIFLAKKSSEVGGQARKYIDIADRELRRVAFIAQQTLGFYRDNSSPTWVSVEDAIRDVLTIYERKFRYKDLTVDCTIEPGLRVYTLLGELKQVISNLLSNAIDACRTGGSIRIKARNLTSSHQVRILVADNGTGMSSEVRHRLFQPFFTTKDQVGTGLGLWATKNMLEKQGCKIVVRSKEDYGTVMSLAFPLPATHGTA
jgi:PAS domain S-box-containing protein